MIQKTSWIAMFCIAIFLILGCMDSQRVLGASSNTQTIKTNVKADAVDARPGVYWYQLNDGRFKADYNGGSVTVANYNRQNVPVTTTIQDTIDLTNYTLPNSFRDSNGKPYTRSQLSRLYILKDSDVQFDTSARSFGCVTKPDGSCYNPVRVDDTKVRFSTKTGGSYPPTTKEKFNSNPDKYKVFYATPLKITWSGEVTETKEIRVVQDSTLQIGGTKQYRAEVRTKISSGAWSSWIDVSSRPETRWTTDNSSVATVSSTGLVTARALGQAKISATFNNGTFDIVASAKATVTNDDSISIIAPSPNVCLGEDMQLSANLTKKDGTSARLTSHPKLTWTSSNTGVATITSSGKVTSGSLGTTTITVRYVDAALGINVSDTYSIRVVDCSVAPPPPPTPEEPTPPPPPANQPPTVTIDGPDEVIVGDNVCYTANASDPDGYITEYAWTASNFVTESRNTATICGYFNKEGDKTVKVTVTDNGNMYGEDQKTASDTKTVTVTNPSPSAYVDIEGVLKENRKLTAKVADPYNGNPTYAALVPITKQTLKIEAVDATNQSKIKIVQNISGNVDDSQVIEWLAKFAGEVKITRYVENSEGLSDTYERIVKLEADQKPVADFYTPTLIFRNPTDIDGQFALAEIRVMNTSYSPDGDILQRWIYEMNIDANNDGQLEEEPLVFDSLEMEVNKEYEVVHPAGNGIKLIVVMDADHNLLIKTSYVGKYKFDLEVWESFVEPTIEQFVDLTFDKSTTDLRFADTTVKPVAEKVVEVDNLAPVVSLEAKGPVKEVDVQYDVLNSPYSQAQLESMTPYLNQLLGKEGLKANVSWMKKQGGQTLLENGAEYMYFVDNQGDIYNAGSSFKGQLGRGTSISNNLAKANFNFSSPIKQIQSGNHTTHFLLENGDVYAVGFSSYGQFGDGDTRSTVTTPKKLTLNFPAPVKKIESKWHQTYFLLENGDVYASGQNEYGQVGDGTTTVRYIAAKMNFNFPAPVKDVVSGASAAYLLLENNEVYKVGDGLVTPARIYFDFSSPINKIKSGGSHVHFLLDNGDVYALGYNAYGQLGDGTTIYRGTPTKMNFNFPSPVVDIESGGDYTHFLLENGDVYSAGLNANGQLGDGTTVNKATPVNISSNFPSPVVQIVSGLHFSHFILKNGDVYVVGNNNYRQLSGSLGSTVSTPTKIAAINPKTLPIFGVFKQSNNSLFTVTLTDKTESTSDVFTKKLANVQAYFIGASITPNQSLIQQAITANNNKGSFIDIGSTYTNDTLKVFVKQLADTIISEMAEKEEYTLQVIADSNVDKTALQSKLTSIVKPMFDANNIPFKEVVVTQRDLTAATSSELGIEFMPFNNKEIVTVVTNRTISDAWMNEIAKTMGNKPFLYVGIGNTANDDQLARFVELNEQKGKVFSSFGAGMDTYLASYGAYLMETIQARYNEQELYVTLDDEVNYFTTFSDYEKDVMLEDRWKYKQFDTIFENGSGMASNMNQYLPTPIKQFTKTGRYQPLYSAKDDPLTPVFASLDIPLFENYRKWSDEADNWFIYAHNAPSAEFSFSVDEMTGEYAIQSLASDVDRSSFDIGYGEGILSQAFSWRIQGDEAWQNGLPASPITNGVVYEIQNTVKDFQDKQVSMVKLMSLDNLPPVAQFTTNKKEYEPGEEVVITNTSYDPNDDDMSAVWYIKNSNEGDSNYRQFAAAEWKNGAVSHLWHPTLNDLTCNNTNSEFCSYTIKLVVTDEKGATAETTQVIHVLISEVLDVGIKSVEVFTAEAEKGLPVYLQLHEEFLVEGVNQIEDARDTPIQIDVYRNGQHHQTQHVTVNNLLKGYMFTILSNGFLDKDTAYAFEFVLSSPFSEKVVINQDMQNIALIARTAAESIIESDENEYEFKGLVSAKKSFDTEQVNTYEKIRINTNKLDPTVTGLGHNLDHTFTYELPINQHYKAKNVFTLANTIIEFDSVLIDSYFDSVTIVDDKANVLTVNTETELQETAQKEVFSTTFSYPKVYVEESTGHLFSEQQKLSNDIRIKQNLIDGGHKLYTPIWLDQLGDYPITYRTTDEIGVNKVKFVVSQELELEAYLFLHMNSTTKDKDKFLLEPANKKNPFPNGKPSDWSESDVEWVKK